MNLDNSILGDVRGALGLNSDYTSFDQELIMHINAALSRLNQNGVGLITVVQDDSTTWNDFIDPTQTETNDYIQLVPLYVTLSTKLIFDPPPPSMNEYYSRSTDELLWRVKHAFEISGGV